MTNPTPTAHDDVAGNPASTPPLPPNRGQGSPSATPRDPGRNGRGRPRAGRWITWVGGALLIGLLVFGFWPQPTPVEATRVKSGPLRVTVSEEGRTRIRHRFTISSPVAGQLRRVPFKAGARIETNQVLAVIDPLTPPLLDARSRTLSEARRETALAQLEKAKSLRYFAARDLERSEKLHKDSALSAQALEQAQWKETAAAREVSTAESALRQAEAELAVFRQSGGPGESPVEVRSSISGSVLRVLEESSRVVVSGAPILEIGDPKDLEAVIEVLSRDGTQIQPNMKVELDHWGGPQPIRAIVRLVEPSAFTKVSALGVQEQRVNIIADLVTPLDERGNLGDQFRIEGRVITWESENVLKAPSGALFHRDDRWWVFVVESGTTQLRAVKVGRQSGPEAQILEGLREGEVIVMYPSDRVRDKGRVKIIAL
ncbi:MAG: efflux RND transporter periplasmic adaptor subunit [Verrucomicrobia bacterium]|nr:efflux RND transporter periplasmic adaptor subunit [Verrucomicrobiota bacterium]MBI3868703.1 efflux RND transporter periplasmic adaptor subunit [Verrucomicrobiota bacterium]